MVRQARHERRSEDFEKALLPDSGPLDYHQSLPVIPAKAGIQSVLSVWYSQHN